MIKKLILVILFIASSNGIIAQRKFGKVEKEAIEQKVHPRELEASAAVLYRYSYTTFKYNNNDGGFYLETTAHEIIKIYNSDGYEWANVTIPVYSNGQSSESVKDIKGITYNLENGEIVKSKLTNKAIFTEEQSKFRDLEKFTMPNIQDGSVIEYTYKFTSPFTFNINEFVFQEDIPVEEVKMKFYAPEYLNYKTHGKGWIPFNIENDTRNRKIKLVYYEKREGYSVRRQGDRREQEVEFIDKGYLVNIKNVPALKKESFTNNIDNYKSALKFELAYTNYPNSPIENYATSWEDVAKKIYKSSKFGDELSKKNYFKNELSEVVSNSDSEQEKLAKIYSFVKNRMTWNEYSGLYTDKGVSRAFKEKVGNVSEINLMLTAMLRSGGFNANPVLISSKSNGIPLYPTSNAFNYVVTGVVVGEDVILLDAADPASGVNLLNEKLLNWQGRMVRKDGSSFSVRLHPKKHAVHNAMVTLEFDEDMVLSGKVQNRYSGHLGRTVREKLFRLKDDALTQEIEKNLNAAEALDIEMKDLTNFNKPFTISYGVEELEMAEQVGDKIYLSPTVFLGLAENYFKAEERNYPIDFSYARKENYIITIKTPKGYAVENIPEALAVNMVDNIANYKFQMAEMGGDIKLTLQRNINTALVPATVYPELKNYFSMIVAKEAEKIVLKKI